MTKSSEQLQPIVGKGNIGAALITLVIVSALASGCDLSSSAAAGNGHHHHKGKSTAQASKSSKPTPHYTLSQTQALGEAKQYLSTQAFSYKGLISQLSSSVGGGFKMADAVFAVNHVGADWNQEAYKAAKEYLSTQNFSRAALIAQLDSPYGGQFTPAQATYAVNKVGLR